MEGQGYDANQAQRSVGGVRAAPPATPVNPSCFGTIEHTASDAARVANRVSGLVDRLAGVAPEGDASNQLKGGPNGLLAEATDYALGIQANLARINAALDRLEKSLP